MTGYVGTGVGSELWRVLLLVLLLAAPALPRDLGALVPVLGDLSLIKRGLLTRANPSNARVMPVSDPLLPRSGE